MESSAIARCIPHESKKRVFLGGSSLCTEPEVSEIAPPLNVKAKGKRKEVVYHEIIDVDIDEDFKDVVLLEGKVDSRKKRKGSMAILLGSSSSANLDLRMVASNNKGKEIPVDPSYSFKGLNPGSNNFFDLDDYVFDDEYSALHFGLPAVVEAPVSGLPDLVPMEKDTPATPFVTSNTHLRVSVSQPKRIDPMATSTMYSSSIKSTAVGGQSTYFDPKQAPVQTAHSNFTQIGSGNY